MYLFIDFMDIPKEYRDVLLEAGIKNTKALRKMSEQEIHEAGKKIHKEFTVYMAAKFVLKKYKEIRKQKHAKKKNIVPVVDIKNKKLDYLKLSLHSKKCLEREDIILVGDLLMLTDKELHKIHTLGRRGEKEIKEKLKNKELSLAQFSSRYDDLEEIPIDMIEDMDEVIIDELNYLDDYTGDNS